MPPSPCGVAWRAVWVTVDELGRTGIGQGSAAAGRNLGDDLPPEPPRHHPRPTVTNALTCADTTHRRYGSCPDLIRDEEAVGSNPATPTGETVAQGLDPYGGSSP